MNKKVLPGLPAGLQSFELIRTGGYCYVDKTEHLYALAQGFTRCFLSRPRRFGKSLTCSTLQALFEGNRELFKGLWIDSSDWQWEKHPVIHLSFNSISHSTPEELGKGLSETIGSIARKNNVDLSGCETLKGKFVALVQALSQQNKVVLIIDEYDKPILDKLHNYELASQMRDALKNFYGAIKDLDQYLRFVFITGVTKFSKVSIFSELNNILELSLDKSVATLCGYTQEELESNFSEHIAKYAQEAGTTHAHLLEKLKKWYNGYQFADKSEKVYNPFSILNCLKLKNFDDYWFESGTPTFLINLVKTKKYPIPNPDVNKIVLSASKLKAFDLKNIDLPTLLAQAGYLTIESYNQDSKNYTLVYPNYEVRAAMSEQIINLMTDMSPEDFGAFIGNFKGALYHNDIDEFCHTLHQFFTQIPYTIHLPDEKYWQSLFFVIVKMMGLDADVEITTNKGRIDATIKTNTNIFVLEFKVSDTPEAAIAQIEDKEYVDKYRCENKPITIVGIQFIPQEKNIDTTWLIKKL